MAASLLSHRINTLLLNARAPFPSQVASSRELIKEYRYAQRQLRLVNNVARSDRDSDPDSYDLGDDLERQR